MLKGLVVPKAEVEVEEAGGAGFEVDAPENPPKPDLPEVDPPKAENPLAGCDIEEAWFWPNRPNADGLAGSPKAV